MARIISGSASARCFLAARTVRQAGSVEQIEYDCRCASWK